MKKTIVLLAGFAFFYFNSNAQVSAQLSGKKLQVVSSLKTTTNMMGQDVPSVADITSNFEVKSVTDKSVSVSGVTKKMKVKVTFMGNEQNIDSDDPNMRDNPQMAEAFKELDKAKDITVELGKAFITEDAIGGQNASDIAKILFIPISTASKEGTKVTDSVVAENGSKSNDIITVTKLTSDEITIQIDNKLLLTGTKQQMGMEAKVNMTATSSAIRVYDVKTGLLKSENKTFSASGTSEAMGQTIPISIKGTSTITVQ